MTAPVVAFFRTWVQRIFWLLWNNLRPPTETPLHHWRSVIADHIVWLSHKLALYEHRLSQMQMLLKCSQLKLHQQTVWRILLTFSEWRRATKVIRKTLNYDDGFHLSSYSRIYSSLWLNASDSIIVQKLWEIKTIVRLMHRETFSLITVNSVSYRETTLRLNFGSVCTKYFLHGGFYSGTLAMQFETFCSQVEFIIEPCKHRKVLATKRKKTMGDGRHPNLNSCWWGCKSPSLSELRLLPLVLRLSESLC